MESTEIIRMTTSIRRGAANLWVSNSKILQSLYHKLTNALPHSQLYLRCDYRFANPALLPPRPNRTLGGTNWRADIAPVRSSMTTSGFCPRVFARSCSSWALPVPSSDLSESFSFCSAAGTFAEAAAAIVAATLDLLRRCPPSRSKERRPSIPSLLTAKKKFFGYMCLSIMCILRF